MSLSSPRTGVPCRFCSTDTAGMFGQSEDPLQKLVREHGWRALENASVFVFVVDGREGLVPADLEIANAVRDERDGR